MRHQLKLIATALTFLTRLPVARFAYPDELRLAQSARYFPLVGVLVGTIGALAYGLAAQLFAPLLSAVLATLAMVVATGAFHEDGLADTADGFGGGFSIERKLEIMKDSRIGSYGAAALLLGLLLRVAALAELTPLLAFAALPIAHALARASSLWLTLALPYVRIGSYKPMADALGWREVLHGMAWMLAFTLISALFLPWSALAIAWCAAALAAFLCARYFRAQIGGVTGDTLGAANQVVEVSVLLAMVAIIG
jgi:adenosylcobinamide-GDP ribazoletransferase